MQRESPCCFPSAQHNLTTTRFGAEVDGSHVSSVSFSELGRAKVTPTHLNIFLSNSALYISEYTSNNKPRPSLKGQVHDLARTARKRLEVSNYLVVFVSAAGLQAAVSQGDVHRRGSRERKRSRGPDVAGGLVHHALSITPAAVSSQFSSMPRMVHILSDRGLLGSAGALVGGVNPEERDFRGGVEAREKPPSLALCYANT